jgi:hypothetical protein
MDPIVRNAASVRQYHTVKTCPHGMSVKKGGIGS